MESLIQINTIIINGKEVSWQYAICPCVECQLYLKENKSPEDKICKSARCTYDKQVARNIANDVFLMMNNIHCENCDTWHSREDVKYSRTCPNCGYDLN
jgi:predicted Zn-ribbon and HTH transcriptional regulator